MKKAKVKKKKLYTLIIAITITVNLLTCFLLLPYSQKTANSHMNSGPALGMIYYIISALTVIAAIIIFFEFKDINVFLLLHVFAATIFYWGYRFYKLYCMGCASCG